MASVPSAFVQTITPPLAYASFTPAPPLKEQAYWLAVNANVSWEKLNNLITSESRWDPEAKSKTGDCGIVQINSHYHPDWPCDRAINDPVGAIGWATDEINKGRESEWVACNCYLMVKTLVPDLPRTKDLVPNSAVHVGAVAIFRYGNLMHYAYVESLKGDTFVSPQSNFKPCLIERREFAYNDPNLLGFWSPAESP